MRVDLKLDNLDPDFLNRSKSENNYVEEDGFFRPATCLSQHKVAIIIPYRDREQHLHILLKHLHGVLQRQLLFYKVFVIEQVSSVFGQMNRFVGTFRCLTSESLPNY